MMPDLTRKEIGKALGIFLVLCLPVTWILMGISYAITPENGSNAVASALLTISMFVPAVAAILTCKITKESIGILKLFPRFRENGHIYIIAIISGVVISVMSEVAVMAFFPKVQRLSEGAMPTMIYMVMITTTMAVMQSFLTLGEEIGWMGYLFPKFEKLCGTTLALIFTGVVRGLWHIVMIMQGEDVLFNFVTLCVSNIVLGSVLVLLTKASKSVLPAAITHVLTNAVPSAVLSFMIIDPTLYDANYIGIYLVGLIPNLIIGVVCYVVLVKKYREK